jgi:hypothetical protein
MTLEQWRERAAQGTSGEMVHDILRDWQIERDRLKAALKAVKDTISDLAREIIDEELEKRKEDWL